MHIHRGRKDLNMISSGKTNMSRTTVASKETLVYLIYSLLLIGAFKRNNLPRVTVMPLSPSTFIAFRCYLKVLEV